MVNLDTTIVRNTDLMAVPMDGDLVMMSISQGTYYGINPVGGRIWTLLEQPASVASLCNTIVSEFEVTKEQCQQDVLQFVEQMLKAGVVSRA
jgi:hypothetical protein